MFIRCRYEAKRVILRQGHRASAFYFILSGSVVVMVYDNEIKAAKPVAYMSKGMTFGVGLITKSHNVPFSQTFTQSVIHGEVTDDLLCVYLHLF